MSNLPVISDEVLNNDDTPLPLIVANRWQFQLANIETSEGRYYAVQDWINGILGGENRKLLSYLSHNKSEIRKSLRMLPYTNKIGKTFQRPHLNEQGLMNLFVNFRLISERTRLVSIRNFIANFDSEYEYLKCSQVTEKQLIESVFQSTLIKALYSIVPKHEIKEYYVLPSGRRIDIILMKKFNNNQISVPLLIECKVNPDEFYKAIGQSICYKIEVSHQFNISTTIPALAIPYNFIDDYIRRIIPHTGCSLISIVNDTIIDVITGKPLLLNG